MERLVNYALREQTRDNKSGLVGNNIGKVHENRACI